MKMNKTLWTAAGLLGLIAIFAPPASADQVISDDLIVNGGSLCVGFDCVNGESFGFDTIRMKENNIRLHFLDTSTSASFPSNDWRISANDTSNGGLNWLGFEDATAGRVPFRVEAGARAHALYVEADGDIGIGTNNPAVQLEIKDGNTPTLRLCQDGSDGFQAQTWDVAGNEANFFIRDATNGSRLPFKIRPGALTGAIDIRDDGDVSMLFNVGVGTTNPTEELHVLGTGTGATRLLIENTNPGNTQVGFRLKNEAEEWQARVISNGDFELRSVGGAAGDELRLENNGNLTIAGTLTTAGSCAIGCDAVFGPDYEVEPIKAHAASMWENQHLPGVGPTPEQGRYNLTEKTLGMLNELEKAHIYIEQLHDRLAEVEAKLTALTAESAD